MTSGALQAAIDRLYGVALEDFVPERTRAAKELRAGGEKDAAKQVAKLPKPTAASWALNHVAREEPEAVAAWLEAAAELREVSTHAAQAGGDRVRGAMGAHREATAALAAVVAERARPGGRPLSGAMLDRVRALLQAATVDPEQAELLRAGRVTEEPGAAGEPAPVAPPAPAAEPKAPPAGEEEPEVEPEPEPEPVVARPRRRRVPATAVAPTHAIDPVTDEIPVIQAPVLEQPVDQPAGAAPLRPRRRRIPTPPPADAASGEVAVPAVRPRRTPRTRSEDDA